MPKITFMGAGSTIFVKNVIGDSLLSPALHDSHVALYDIDPGRLKESRLMLDALNANLNHGRARITTHLGVGNRREALRGADYVVNAIQVGGYKPATVIDFEVPKKYGLRQTIADTLGIGGIFRALRTIPVILDFARDMEKVCPNAWFLNYTNPMAMLTASMLRGSSIKTVGLCHSVQGCATTILTHLGMTANELQWKIAGINHQAWLLEITDGGKDLYPEIKARAAAMLEAARKKGAQKHWDMVRHYLMLNFGYYITESSEHSSEYLPYFIKSQYPELIKEFNIPLDEYPRRCVAQIESWKKQSLELVHCPNLLHTRSNEYGSYIMEAMETDVPFRIGGNVMNNGLITNLPARACVEVACLVDRNGVQPCFVGDLPEQLAALNRTNINPQTLTVEAALTGKKEHIYHAAMLDPHTSAELPIDKIRRLCDDLIAAHGNMLPKYNETVIKPMRLKTFVAPNNIVPMHVIGPFENGAKGASLGLTRVLPPEKSVDLKARYAGKDGKKIGWKRVAIGDLQNHGYYDFIALLGNVDLAVAYACAMIRSNSARQVVIELGSDDGIAAWLNGEEILRVEAARAAMRAQNEVVLNLKKGLNHLLFKVDQKSGAWGLYANFKGNKPAGIKVV
jgi:alpha-galactosidase